jgi:hypothetical protein
MCFNRSKLAFLISVDLILFSQFELYSSKMQCRTYVFLVLDLKHLPRLVSHYSVKKLINKIYVIIFLNKINIINITSITNFPMAELLPKGILFHKLKGTRGWSSFFTQDIDVANIERISYRKRLFKIFDRDRDYTIWITYRQMRNSVSIAPTITGNGNKGITLVDTVKVSHLLTLRYVNEEDAIKEINEIQQKRDRLKKYDDERYHNIRKDFPDQ